MLMLCTSTASFAQLSIEDCYAKAKANYPLIKQYDLIEQARDYNLSNVARIWLPQVQLSAKATYQSEVTQIPIDFSTLKPLLGDNLPLIPELSKNQYGATVEVSQTIWDGGVTGAKRESIRAKAGTEQKNLEVSLYAVNERVNQLFFGILLFDAMLGQNRLFQDELQRNYDRVSSCMQNGIANASDLDVVKVEQLKAKQNRTQIEHNRKASVETLSALIGEKIEENTCFQKPDVRQPFIREIQRPELAFFDAQYKNLDAATKEIKAGLMPKLGLFITGGYGKPGLNMLKDDFFAYYIGGICLTWNFSNFYTKKNNLNLIESNRNAIQIQRETFLFNTLLHKTGKENEIDKYREL
ncbi:hypothetical protein EZS27_036773, partial [termite gut metagenome]